MLHKISYDVIFNPSKQHRSGDVSFEFTNAYSGRLCPILRINNSSALDEFEGIGYIDESASHTGLPCYSGIIISVKCGKLLSNSTTNGKMQVLFAFASTGGGFLFSKKYRYYNNGEWTAWTDMP